jgi:hypothetical protein
MTQHVTPGMSLASDSDHRSVKSRAVCCFCSALKTFSMSRTVIRDIRASPGVGGQFKPTTAPSARHRAHEPFRDGPIGPSRRHDHSKPARAAAAAAAARGQPQLRQAYGATVGSLTYRPPERQLSEAEQRLVRDLARQLGGALHARLLREDLQRAVRDPGQAVRTGGDFGVGPAQAHRGGR